MRWPTLVALLILSAVRAAAAPAPVLWRGLEPGPYAVGYRSTLERDLSRTSLVKPGQPGREMRVSFWYPARSSKRTPIAFERYVTDLGRRTAELPDAPALAAGRDEFIAVAAGGRGTEDSIRAALPRLLALRTAAVADAQEAPGRHPLVLFPDFRSPPTASVMAEYLASHGFVVATVDMKGTFDDDYDLGLSGMETQVQDLRFVLGRMRSQLVVDGARVAAMGVGISANACLAFQMRDPTVRALVSLDGGLLSTFEDGVTRRTPYWDPWATTIPLLAIHAPHPALDPKMLDTYRYAALTRIHFPRMSEFHFLSFGAIEGVIPSVLGPPPGDVNAGFAAAARHVRMFLARHLLDHTDARQPEGMSPDSLYEVVHRAALPPPPTLAAMKAMLIAGGSDSLARHWRRLHRQDPEPISLVRFTQVLSWIANVWTGDRDGRHRRGVLELRLEAFPRSTRAHAALAQLYQTAGERDRATQRARDALGLIDADTDPELDARSRESIRTRMRRVVDEKPSNP